MLAVHNLSVNYRGIEALTAVSLTLNPCEWVGLIGPNGAGKSTLIKAILGLMPLSGKDSAEWNFVEAVAAAGRLCAAAIAN